MAKSPKQGSLALPGVPRFSDWSRKFLAELAATSNVTAAARKAGIHTAQAYEARRTRPEFNRAWQQALCEGYDHLEMELLYRLRNGEIKPAAGAKKGVRNFDNGIAFRLLLAHKDSVMRQRAVRDNLDSEAIIRSINAKFEKIRERRAEMLPPPDRDGADE